MADDGGVPANARARRFGAAAALDKKARPLRDKVPGYRLLRKEDPA